MLRLDALLPPLCPLLLLLPPCPLCAERLSTWRRAAALTCPTLQPNSVTYADIAERTYGRWMRNLVDALLVFMQFGFATVYMGA